LKQLLLVALLLAARRPVKHHAAAHVDPARFFATHPGLIRIYEGRSGGGDDQPPAGASCEVLSSSAASVKETCSMIVGRKAKPSTELTYELRKDGIWNTQVRPEGAASPQPVARLVLPAPLAVGASWKEPRGGVELDRTVKSAGGACRAAGRSFADCLVVSVVQKQGKAVVRRYTETYAAGVGLVEDLQWELVDVKGL
jgi:hypothetical protein